MTAISRVQAGHIPAPTQEEGSKWTTAKTKKLVLNIFAALTLTAAATVVGLALGSIIAMPWAWLALPLAILGIAAIYWSCTTLDYDDARELRTMRAEAHNMTFEKLYRKHGVVNLLDRIAQGNGPTKAQLIEKFNREIQGVESFDKILKTYDTQALSAAGIIDGDHARLLMDLKRRARTIEGEYEYKRNQIDLRHPGRSDKLRQHAQQAQMAGHGVAGIAVSDPEKRRKVDAGIAIGGAALQVAGQLAGRQEQMRHDEELGAAAGHRGVALDLLNQEYRNYIQNLV